jgi:hypothetical protein
MHRSLVIPLSAYAEFADCFCIDTGAIPIEAETPITAIRLEFNNILPFFVTSGTDLVSNCAKFYAEPPDKPQKI